MADFKEKTQVAVAKLEDMLSKIMDSEAFTRYLLVQSAFHKYSYGNVALILAQRPTASRVAGFKTWLKVKRCVRKGEKGIMIFVPMRKKYEDEDTGEVSHGRLFFGVGYVFDVEQTDGEPLPALECPILVGEDGAGLYDALKTVVESEGLHLAEPKTLGGELMGYYDGKTIHVRADVAMQQRVKTLAHELGHHFARHIAGELALTRGEMETEAEAIAFVVCHHFNVDTSVRSVPYIATWAKDIKIFRLALERIQKSAAQIINLAEGVDVKERELVVA